MHLHARRSGLLVFRVVRRRLSIFVVALRNGWEFSRPFSFSLSNDKRKAAASVMIAVTRRLHSLTPSRNRSWCYGDFSTPTADYTNNPCERNLPAKLDIA